MNSILKNKKIYITPYSDGSKIFKNYLDTYLDKYTFLGYIDSGKTGEDIYSLDDIHQEFDYILVFSENYYLNIYTQLKIKKIKNTNIINITRENGKYILNEMNLPEVSKNRKKIVCFGNCQANHIAKLLRLYLDYSEYTIEYYINYGPSYNLDVTERGISDADILIYQPLNKNHGKLSSENIVNCVKKDCTLVTFPYIYNNGVYSLEYNGKRFTGKESILALLEKNKTKSEILSLYLNGEIDFDLENRFRKSLNIMKERVTDIKLIEYIENNYSKYKLFSSCAHPTGKIYDEILIQLNELLFLKMKLNKELSLTDQQSMLAPISPYDVITHKYTFNYRQDTQWDIQGIIIIELIIANYKMGISMQ